MSGISDALFGSEGAPSQVVDATPSEDAAWRKAFASAGKIRKTGSYFVIDLADSAQQEGSEP